MPEDQILRARFQKSHHPYGLRICEETLPEIMGYEDCQVLTRDGEFEAVAVHTSEGTLQVEGGWLLEDAGGGHYPISDEQLEAMYETATTELE